MATNGTNQTQTTNPAAVEPTEEELRDFMEEFLKNRPNLKMTVENAMATPAIRNIAIIKLMGKRMKEQKELEEKIRREVNAAVAIITEHVRARIEELSDKLSAIAVNNELVPKFDEPSGDEIKAELRRQIEVLNLTINCEDITAIDCHSLTKQMLHKERELVAKQSVTDTQDVLNALSELPDPESDSQPMNRIRTAPEPLWKRMAAEKEGEEAASAAVTMKRTIANLRSEYTGHLPGSVFNDESVESTGYLLSGLRGRLIKSRREALQKLEAEKKSKPENSATSDLLSQKEKEIQETIDLVTAVYQMLFGRKTDPGAEANKCPQNVYNDNVSAWEDFFKELFDLSKATVKPQPTPKPARDPKVDEAKRLLLKETTEKLRNGGFAEHEAAKIAAKIVKKYCGDIARAALGKREEMENPSLSDEEKVVIRTQLEMLSKASEISLEEIEERFEARKSDQVAATEHQNSEKDNRLAPMVAVPMSAKKARQLAEHARKAREAKKSGKKDAGVSRHRK